MLLLAVIAAGPVPNARANDCHSDHYCGICKCRLYFRGDPPTEVPVIAGIAPRDCVCPYSHSMPADKRCAPTDIDDIIGMPATPAFQAPRPRIENNVDGAVYGSGPRPASSRDSAASGNRAPAPAENEVFIDPHTIPREMQFESAPKVVKKAPPPPVPPRLPQPAAEPPPLPPLRLQ